MYFKASVAAYVHLPPISKSLNGGDGGGVWILLFSEVTLFEYNGSTILSPIVGRNCYFRNL